MPGPRRLIGLLLLLLLASPSAGDVLELRDGRALEGRLLGVEGGALHFETRAGVVAVPIADAALLRFTGAPPAARAPGAGPTAPAAGSTERAAAPRTVQLAAGTKLRVRVKDSLDPRRGTEGDRFTALLETPIAAGERVLAPVHSAVYGVVTAASPTGPLQNQLRLELTELQVHGRRVAIVTGSHTRVDEGADAPAKRADPPEARLDAGTLLEFRLLQPVALPLQ